MRKNILIALSIFLCSSTLLNAETYKLTSSGFINSETNNSEYIIEIPGVSQDNLYKSTKVILASESSYSNSQITDIDNETIIINGKDDNKIYAKFHNRDGNLWKYLLFTHSAIFTDLTGGEKTASAKTLTTAESSMLLASGMSFLIRHVVHSTRTLGE